MRVLIVDDYDSFTHSLVHLLEALGVVVVGVRRNGPQLLENFLRTRGRVEA